MRLLEAAEYEEGYSEEYEWSYSSVEVNVSEDVGYISSVRIRQVRSFAG